jgi:hypothetical protein
VNTDLHIENRSDFDTGRVMDLIEYATRGHDVSDVGFLVENQREGYKVGGYAQRGQPRYNPWKGDETNRFLIVIRLCLPEREDGTPNYPQSNNVYNRHTGRTEPYGGKRSPYIEMGNWQEALVRIAAHEIEHIAQHREHRIKWESECENVALAALKPFRLGMNFEATWAAYSTHPCPVPETAITAKGEAR